MHDLGGWLSGTCRFGEDPRSSVASKRFPLSKERLARFRFAWSSSWVGAGCPEWICESRSRLFAWTNKGWRL